MAWIILGMVAAIITSKIFYRTGKGLMFDILLGLSAQAIPMESKVTKCYEAREGLTKFKMLNLMVAAIAISMVLLVGTSLPSNAQQQETQQKQAGQQWNKKQPETQKQQKQAEQQLDEEQQAQQKEAQQQVNQQKAEQKHQNQAEQQLDKEQQAQQKEAQQQVNQQKAEQKQQIKQEKAERKQQRVEQRRLSQEQQQKLIDQQKQRLAQYRQELQEQERLAEQRKEQLQQQKRMAQYRFQQQYLEDMRQQQKRLQNKQNYNYNNDPYFFTAPNYRYSRNGRYYETNQYGADQLKQAVNYGYAQGYRAGQADREDGWGYNYKDSYAYQDANYGYSGMYMDQNEYNHYFREGFSRGYEDSYNSRYQYGSNSGGNYSILGTVMSQILNFQSLVI
jgi:uncharacterized membrane protein YeaQ/YmgE (transglycosylase-associated protein family)